MASKNIKLGNGKIIEINEINIHKQKDLTKYAVVLEKISKSAGQNPENHIYKWINASDYLLVAKDIEEQQDVGFTMFRFLDNKVIYTGAMMINPAYQKKGIGNIFSNIIVKKFFIARLRNFFWNPFRALAPIYFIFRTQNPTVYYSYFNKVELYPNPNGTDNLAEKALNIASKYVTQLWPNAKFNKKTFVLKNAYMPAPGLALRPNKISWSKNRLINEMFERKLHLKQGSLDSLVVVGKIKLITFLKNI